jgi:hypothetical protein
MTYVLMCIVHLSLYYQVFEIGFSKSFSLISFFLVAMSICLWAILKVVLVGHVPYIKISWLFFSFWPFLFIISIQCEINCTRCLTRFCIYFFLCFQHIITFHDLCLCMFLFECLFKCSVGFFFYFFIVFHSYSFFASLLFLCLYTKFIFLINLLIACFS